MSLGIISCQDSTKLKKPDEQMKKVSIEEVIKSHTQELLAIKGVTGLYTGELDNGNQCIIIMIENDSARLKNILPKDIDSYPVKLEVTGKIKPM